MKICHLTSVHPYNDARIFHKECISLANAGFDVTLIAPVDNRLFEQGVTVLPAGSWNNRYSRLLVTVPRLLFHALRKRARIYHIHDPELLTIAPLLRLSGAAVVYDIHEDYVTSIPQKSYIPKALGKPLAQLVGNLESFFSLWCQKVIAEKYYRERFPVATAVLNYPLLFENKDDSVKVDLSQFDPQWDWLLYTGNVTPDRGALNHLQFLAASKNSALAYIGRCPTAFAEAIYAEADRKSIQRSRIRIIGVDSFVSPEIIAGYTHRGKWLAGLALFPETQHYAKKELTKFFEYMSAGLPVIASNFPAWKSVIEENNCGFCLSPQDLQGISQAVARLQGDPELARNLGVNGKKSVSSKYHWETQAGKLVGLYKDILEK